VLRCERGWVTLIELMVVTAIIVVVIALLYGRGSGGRVAGGETSGQAQTAPGVALEKARGIECQQNLQGLRQAISAYRIDSEQPPASLDEIRGAAKTCPVSGNPYVYDPQTGTVRCTTPGHENF
jgi:hypothetical protein